LKTICFFNSTKAWGGGEKWHFDVATRLAKKNIYRIIVFTHPNSELYKRLKTTKLTIYPIQISNFSFLNPIKVGKIVKILQEEKVDTILMNLSADVKIAGIASQKAGVRRIIYRRGLAKPIKNRWLNRILFRQIITDIICNSEETQRTIFANNQDFIAPEKVKVIYNGIDLEEYDKRLTKKIYQSKNQEVIIGNAGRLVEQKGQKHLIELAKILTKKGLQFKILIAGKGKLEQELKEMAIQEKVADKIVFLGFVKNIKNLMQSIDIFVLTSYWEGFGYVLVEAMACQKPVIAFNLTSNPEIIETQNEEKRTGFLAPQKDMETISNHILQLVKNPKLSQKIGKSGRQRVEKQFDINRTIQEVEAYF